MRYGCFVVREVDFFGKQVSGLRILDDLYLECIVFFGGFKIIYVFNLKKFFLNFNQFFLEGNLLEVEREGRSCLLFVNRTFLDFAGFGGKNDQLFF